MVEDLKSGRARGWVAMTAFVGRHALRSFLLNRCLQHAATLAYFGFLALMPMLLLSVYLLGQALASSEAVERALATAVTGMFPTFNPELLTDLTRLADSKSWGVLSVLLLVWSMTPFAGALRGILQALFKEERRVAFVRAKLWDLVAVFLLLGSFLAFAASRVVLPEWLTSLVAFPLTWGIVTTVYMSFSPVRLPWSEAIAGGLVAAALLAFLRPLFGLLLSFNPGYGYAFGSVKTIFLLLVWVYYLFAVVLLGAEVAANLHRREALLLRGVFAGEKKGRSRLMSRFERVLSPGERLFAEGDAGREMFHVLDGEVDLLKSGQLIKRAGPGEYFGEMSLLLKAARTATAVARTECRLLVISEDNLDRILRENPAVVMTILREMGERLKATTARSVSAGG